MTGAKEMLQVTGIGTIRVKTNNGSLVVLTKVMLVLKLAASLISLFKFLKTGNDIEGNGRTMQIHNHRHTYQTILQSVTLVRRHMNTPTMF